jgi:surface protein
MSFNQFKLSESFNQSREIFNKYIYDSNDPISEITALGYFSESRFLISDPDKWKGSFIDVNSFDGYLVIQITEDGLSGIQAGAGNKSVINVTDTSKTLSISDNNTLQVLDNVLSQTLIIPSNSDVPFSVGDEIDVFQEGVGLVSIFPDDGVTILSVDGFLSISSQNSLVTIQKIDTDTWILTGSLGSGNSYISTWETLSPSETIALPLISSGTYSFFVQWGDGSDDVITAFDQSEVTHIYASAGDHVITIGGTIKGFTFNDGGDKLKIKEISRWGSVEFTDDGWFFGCSNLTTITAPDTPTIDPIGTVSIASIFQNCTSLANITAVNQWDVSAVNDMRNAFENTLFNQDIDSWNVSNVVFMQRLFQASLFNQSINSWVVSNVEQMGNMFEDSPFNQDLNSWDVSSLLGMPNMFRNTPFNGDITSWNVGNVITMNDTFRDASAFDQDISGWNVSSVTTMREMLQNASAFDQDISGWIVSSVADMTNMLLGSAFSTSNYDLLLIAWNGISLQSNVVFNAGTAQFNVGAPAAARTSILVNDLWVISDGGQV